MRMKFYEYYFLSANKMKAIGKQCIALLLITVTLTLVVVFSVLETVRIPYMTAHLVDRQPLSTFQGDKSNLICLESHPQYPQYTFFGPIEDPTWLFALREPLTDPGRARNGLTKRGFMVHNAETARCFWSVAKRVYRHGVWRGSIYYQAADRGPMDYIKSWTLKERPAAYWIAKAEAVLLGRVPWIEYLLIYGLGGLGMLYVIAVFAIWRLNKGIDESILEELELRSNVSSS